jgi:hypothetical protein
LAGKQETLNGRCGRGMRQKWASLETPLGRKQLTYLKW